MNAKIFISIFFVNSVLGGEISVDGPVFYKGELKDGSFVTRSFVASKTDKGFQIKTENGVANIQSGLDVLEDCVTSGDDASVAVLCSNDTRGVYELHAIGPGDLTRKFVFKEYRMTEHFDGIMEVGAVSNSGEFLLLKCAKLMPADTKTGRRRVSHEWIVAKIARNKLEVLEKHSGLDKWNKY